MRNLQAFSLALACVLVCTQVLIPSPTLACPEDTDADGICDALDNCPDLPNPDQADTDADGLGDVCDPCPMDATNSCVCLDTDGDGLCDDEDPDDDNDGVPDVEDVDPLNPFVCRDVDADTCDDCALGTDGFGPLPDVDPLNDGPDFDADGQCDPGDVDDDNDGIPDAEDPCPLDPTNTCTPGDIDGDGIPDDQDNCPVTFNPDQSDLDADGLGDVCDPCPTDPTNSCNCPDLDGDGVCDANDNCPDLPNPDQADTDGDGLGDVCDPCPMDPTNSCVCLDTDGDGLCDDEDPDDDNDGVPDVEDVDPLNPFVCRDVDADTCDDCALGTDGFGPLPDVDPLNDGPDFDADGQCDPGDDDDDNDGIPDAEDPCPLDPTNTCTPGDADGDGIPDNQDNCPWSFNPDQSDIDADGLGDVCDPCPDDASDPCPACEFLPPNAESWWPGDVNELDLIGGHHPAGTFGSPAFVPAHVGLGFKFSGADGYIVPQDPGLDCTTYESISILAWVRVDGFSPVGRDTIVDKRSWESSSDAGYVLYVQEHEPGKVRIRFRISDGAVAREVATRPIAVDGFHHVAAVLDRQAGTIAIYVDGRLQRLRSHAVTDLSNAGAFHIGRPFEFSDAQLQPFDGVIDELQFFVRALSRCEIAAIHAAGSPGICRGDLDGDGIFDYEDNCTRAMNPDQTDQDLDGAGDPCDCNPSAYEVFRAPGEACGLGLGAGGTKHGIDWCPQHLEAGDATVYTLVRGSLSELPVGSGEAETCLRSALRLPETVDSTEPSVGDGFWYLLRANNACGSGGYGSDSAGTPRGGQVPGSCPLSEEEICGQTGGTWDPWTCGHWVCGWEPDCDAIIPGCNCGPNRSFGPGVGCSEDPNCN